LPAGNVLVTDTGGKVLEIINREDAGDDLIEIAGMLSPGFINCHCHLELSHMKGMIQRHLGMTGFLRWVVQHRDFAADIIQEGIREGEAEMLRNGIVAVGDISNTTDTILAKSNHRLRYVNFIEALGFNDTRAAQTMLYCTETELTFNNQTGFSTSVVPHAPYTVSPALFELIEENSVGKVISMHNQESLQEEEFMLTGTGDFRQIFQDLKMDIGHYKGRGKNSLGFAWQYLDSSLKTILVHNVTTTQEDLDQLDSEVIKRFYWCLCVNANKYINNILPPIGLFRKNGCHLVIGTDSLASNDSLSILDEIKSIVAAFPALPQQEILQWATSNGAEALDVHGEFGTFEPGKSPGIIQLNLLENGMICEKTIVHRIA